MDKKNKSLKKASILFGMSVLLFSSTSWGISHAVLKMTELLFFLYLVHWLDSDKSQRKHMKLIFFCLFIAGTGLGGLNSNIILKAVITAFTILAAMLYLYSIKIEITFDRHFLLCFFSAVIYLPFAYIDDFFKKTPLTRIERIKKQKTINGIIISSIIVILIFIPLYACGDSIFSGWIEVIVGWLLNNILYFLTAIILCWIPAMLVYSYVRGLDLNSVPSCPPDRILNNIDKNKMFFNLFSIKSVLIGSITANCLFVASQLIYFFEPNKDYNKINSLGHMSSIFAAVFLNILLLTFLTLVIKEKQINKYSISLSSFNIYYAISIVMIWVALCWRYAVTVFHYGLKGIWPLWGLTMLLFLAVVAWNVMGVLWNYQKFVKTVCYGTATLLLLFTICIPEFWVGKINIMIFDYKYTHNLLVNSIDDNTDISTVIIKPQDLDIEYLKTLNEWAVPALLTVKDIPNIYEGSGKTLSDIAEEEIFTILEKDLTVAEMESMEGLASSEKMISILSILSEKAEYRLPGTKRLILNLVKKSFINE